MMNIWQVGDPDLEVGERRQVVFTAQPEIRCGGDLDNDGDIDGSDLARLAIQPDLLDFCRLCSQFGSAACE